MSTPAGILSPVWADTHIASLVSEEALLEAMIEVEAAWVSVLEEAGAASSSSAAELHAIAKDPQAAGVDVNSVAAAGVGGGNPVIPLLKDLREILAERGVSDEALHRGATSQDILDTALVLLTHRAAQTILSNALTTADALAELADAHRDTVCIARSLTQHGLPTCFGLRVAGWLDGICEAATRLDSAVGNLPLQWGGAVGTQAALTDAFGATEAARLTDQLGKRLGLPVPSRPWHTQRQPILEVSSALAGLLAALGKAAGDVLTLQRPEIAELREPAASGRGGSSAMPQKQNPVLATLIRSAAVTGPQLLAGLHQAAAFAMDERPDGAWHAEWPQLTELLRLTGGAIARSSELFSGLQVYPGAMQRNYELTGPAAVSERLVARLTDSFPGGAAALKHVIARSSSEGLPLRELLRKELPIDTISEAQLDHLLDPAGYLGRAQEFIDAALDDYATKRMLWKQK